MKQKICYIILTALIAAVIAFFVTRRLQKNTAKTSKKTTNNNPTFTDEERNYYNVIKRYLQNYISNIEEKGYTPACYASIDGDNYYIHTDFEENEAEGGQRRLMYKTVFDKIVSEFNLNII